jgi:hypothetical protein
MKLTRLALALIAAAAVAAPATAQQAPPAQQVAQADPPAAAAPAVMVDAVLTRNVVDRMPTDSATSFTPDVGQVTLWMRASGAEGQVLHHVWFHGETELGNVPLTIGGSPWRSWTRKVVTPEMTGAWHVEIRDAAGTVLKRIDFTVQ